MSRSFVVIYYGNTGSSWLTETISTSPQVLVPAFEPLESWAWQAPAEEKLAWIRAAFDPPDPHDPEAVAAWQEKLSASPQYQGLLKPDFSMTGFKMSDGILSDREALADVLKELGTRVITLSRENRIKHALSLYRYHEEGKSQFEAKGVRPPTKVNMTKFARWIAESTRLHNHLEDFCQMCDARLGDRHLRVAYEEFVTPEGKQATIEKVCGFLGLDPELLIRSRFEKATPDDLASAISNYGKLQRRLFFTPYRKYLD